MGQTRKPKTMQTGAADDFQTDPAALRPLFPHLWRLTDSPNVTTVWEPACGQGRLLEGLRKDGLQVIGTDIKQGQDFLHCRPTQPFDCIVTNPPFSLKDQFLARCYELGKPWALLLPLTTFEGRKRQRMFRDRGVQVIFLPKRVEFITPSGKGGGAWFMTAWFTWGLNLPDTLTFWDEAIAFPRLPGMDGVTAGQLALGAGEGEDTNA